MVLPLFLQGVDVNAWDIASSLMMTMLVRLGVGFREGPLAGYRRRAPAVHVQASTVAIPFMMAGGIILSWSDIVDLAGTGGLLAAVVFLLGALAMGYVSGGSEPGTRSVLGLGTAQRNLSAALVVGAQNFSGEALAYVIVIAFVGLATLMPIAGELGKRSADVSSGDGTGAP